MELVFQPDLGALPIRFGFTASEVWAALGQQPSHVMAVPLGQTMREEHFDDFVGVHYDFNDRVYSVVAAPGSVVLRFMGVELIGPNASANPFTVLAAMEDSPFEDLGFIVFDRLGIALTGYHDGQDDQRAMTMIRPGTWGRTKYATDIRAGALGL